MNDGAILGKFGIEVFKAAGPSVWGWIRTQVIGKDVLFLGPSRSGKTSLINFIRAGQFTDPDDFVPRTIVNQNKGSIQIKSQNKNLQIDLKRVIDTVGQDSPSEHASLIGDHSPHAVCIVLDGSVPWGVDSADANRDNMVWLQHFFDQLCIVREERPACFRRLKSVTILLNKVDKVDAVIADKRILQIKNLANKSLTGVTAKFAKMMNVKKLSLVENYQNGELPAKAMITLFNPFVRD